MSGQDVVSVSHAKMVAHFGLSPLLALTLQIYILGWPIVTADHLL